MRLGLPWYVSPILHTLHPDLCYQLYALFARALGKLYPRRYSRN